MNEHTSPIRGPVHTPQAARETHDRAGQASLADEVRYYLQLAPRQLPSRLLYDALGSALFDAICHLPWYRITRSELSLLRQQASTIGRALGSSGRLVELGCGNGEKLATLLAHAGMHRVHAHLIDLSDAALVHSSQILATLEGMDVHVTTHQATYEDGLLALSPNDTHPTLIALLGSNIGNFDPPGAAEFLELIRAALRPCDYLLLGADLVKPADQLVVAYDDPLGVTAAFNKNLLLRMNTELGANFDLDAFSHRAIWNGDASRVEMHLVSRKTQDVRVSQSDLQMRLEEGETIWTESSYKYEPDGVGQLVEPAGFVQLHQWIDDEARFALTLFQAG
jgi:L-histidine Nalpha-methyltransferase